MNKYTTQVKKDHYDPDHYLNLDRWISYYHQLSCVALVESILKRRLSIFEIGIGDKIVNSILKNSHKVFSMDIDGSLKPDLISALPNIPFSKKDSFDCIICCEVLEHIKYSDAETSLKKMAKISKFLIISLPHKSFYISASIRFPFIKRINLLFTLATNFVKHKFNGEHYWELGTKDYDLSSFKKTLANSNLEILKEYRIAEYPYHHFFLLKTKRDNKN